jgi:hypothetical protein
MIASPTLPAAAPGTASGRFVSHGRQLAPRARYRAGPAPEEDQGDEADNTALFLRTQEFAWLTNRVIFAVSDGQHLDLVLADKYSPTPEQTIEQVAWPPGWRYRPRRRKHGQRTF